MFLLRPAFGRGRLDYVNKAERDFVSVYCFYKYCICKDPLIIEQAIKDHFALSLLLLQAEELRDESEDSDEMNENEQEDLPKPSEHRGTLLDDDFLLASIFWPN